MVLTGILLNLLFILVENICLFHGFRIRFPTEILPMVKAALLILPHYVHLHGTVKMNLMHVFKHFSIKTYSQFLLYM